MAIILFFREHQYISWLLRNNSLVTASVNDDITPKTQELNCLEGLSLGSSKMFFRYATTRIFFLLFAMFVIAPLTLMVWRGIWGLLDEYITTINDEVNITSATYHPSTGCHFNTSEEPNLKNTHPGTHRIRHYTQFLLIIFLTS